MNASKSKIETPKYGVWPWVVPFLALMFIGFFEPRFGEVTDSQHPWVAAQVRGYLLVYSIKIAVIALLIGVFCRTYLAAFAFSVTRWAVAIGVLGVVLWIGICNLQIESFVLGLFGNADLATRSEFDPFQLIEERWQLVVFFGVRLIGLTVVVPIAEELFLRGFLLRIFEDPNWWRVRLAEISTKTLLIAPLYGAATHPGEFVAAIVWFTLINWLMKRTGKFWDCVLAHAVTNGLLGAYVIAFSQWQFW